MRLDPAALRTVQCYGGVSVSDAALELLFGHEIEVAFLSAGGTRCRGRLVRARPSQAPLRLRQLRAFDRPEGRLGWAARLVALKVESQVKAARHYQRHGRPAAGAALPALADVLAKVPGATTADQLRGLEGAASATWFGVLGGLFAEPWTFTKRVRRPPTDPVNALLSLGYIWLLTRAVARCEATGLETAVGALHEYRPGRPSLACDLIEPLRVPAVDRWVVEVCNGSVVVPADFVAAEGGIRLRPAAFARMLRSWEAHWVTNGPEEQLDAVVTELVAYLRPPPNAATEPAEDGDL